MHTRFYRAGDTMNRLIGKYIKDTNGIEIGEIVGMKDGFFELDEGVFGTFLLDVTMVVAVGEEATLDADVQTLLHGRDVFDKDRKNIGKVYDVMEAGEVIDYFLVEYGKELFSVPIENIHRIGAELELNIDLDEVKYIQEEHTFREEIKHKILEFING